MSDDAKHELTPEDKRILKHVANRAREQMPSRRDALKMGAVGVAAAGIGTGVTGAAMGQADENDNVGDVGTPSNPVDVFGDGISANTLSVTGETYVEAYRSTTASGIASGTFTNIVDTEAADELDEFNASQQFSPNETDKYLITVNCRIDPGADGDLIQLRLQDVGNGNTVEYLDRHNTGGSSGFNTLTGSWIGTLNAGTTYEIQANDNDNSFDLIVGGSGENETGFTIVKSVVHPN